MSRKKISDAEREKAARLDARLDRELAALKAPIPAPGLWQRIEAGLEREKGAGFGPAAFARTRRGLFRGLPFQAPLPAYILVLAVLGLGAYFGARLVARPPGLLAAGALAKIEVKEREYVRSIEELEAAVRPKMAALEGELASLYRSKLDAIDAQIGRCREALGANPANTHIRRYLLAALRDKREALAELAGTSPIPKSVS
jgi:hypothetical protein